LPDTAETLPNRIANAGEPLRSDAREGSEPAVVRRHFELLEAFDAELVKAAGRDAADPRDGGEDALGVGFPAQPVQHRQPPRRRHLVIRSSESGSDPGQRFELRQPTFTRDFHDGLREPADDGCGPAIRTHAKRVGTLSLENLRQLVEAARDGEILGRRRAVEPGPWHGTRRSHGGQRRRNRLTPGYGP
jgi:hypothetical protein